MLEVRTAPGLVAAVAAVALMAGCTSATNGSGSAPSGPSSTPTSTSGSTAGSGAGTPANSFPASSTGAVSVPPTGALTKAQFVAAMDGECRTVLAKTQALPQPTSDQDYPGLHDALVGTLALLPPYLATAKSLAGRSPDNAELTANWISVEAHDFAVEKPLLVKLIAASGASDAAQVKSLENQLDAIPDHSADIAQFMTGYGLTDCATLEAG